MLSSLANTLPLSLHACMIHPRARWIKMPEPDIHSLLVLQHILYCDWLIESVQGCLECLRMLDINRIGFRVEFFQLCLS